MGKYYAGLMSGTSLDGVDCVIYDFEHSTLIASSWTPYSLEFKTQIQTLSTPQSIAETDVILCEIYSSCVLELLKKHNIASNEVIAIGSHGQTIYHNPKQYSWQLGNGERIAKLTGITTISDFRNADILAGGQGAPLTPKYHQYLLNNKDGVVINLGGIANITQIRNGEIIGFDSGPANTLINNVMLKYKNIDYDRDGLFARSGVIIDDLLNQMLDDEYFTKTPPKSTGVEYFNLDWLDSFLSGNEKPQDIVRTLTELTAITISKNLTNGKVYCCGGGVCNAFVMERLQYLSLDCEILTTMELGVHPNFVEAVAFAYFAKLHIEKKTGNLPSVSGAKKAVILGTTYEYQ